MDLFEWVGLGDVTGLDLLFASAALVGGLLFIAWFFLLMIGGLAGGLLDGVGVDVDMGADLSFKAFTFQGIVAFVLMFGLVGLALSRSDMHQMVALLAGTAAGGALQKTQMPTSRVETQLQSRKSSLEEWWWFLMDKQARVSENGNR